MTRSTPELAVSLQAPTSHQGDGVGSKVDTLPLSHRCLTTA
ncbi:hypothetical protein AVEN_66992-1, partial [Araneus ventricosus]